MATKMELLANWYRDVWEHGDPGAIDKYFHANAQASGIVPDLMIDTGEFRELVTVILTMVSNISVDFLHVVEQDDWLCALLRINGEPVGSADRLSVHSQVMIRVEDGYIAEAYNSFDFLSFFEHLGQLPPNALPLLMSGTHLS